MPLRLREGAELHHTARDGDWSIEMEATEGRQLPAGRPALLLLDWITTIFTLGKREREGNIITLGSSKQAMLRNMGLEGRGGGAAGLGSRYADQLDRLLYTRFTLRKGERVIPFKIAEAWTIEPRRPVELALTPEFAELVKRTAVPYKRSTVAELGESTAAVALYRWITYRLRTLRGRKLTIPLRVIQHQIGSTFTRLRDFRYHARRLLQRLASAWLHGVTHTYSQITLDGRAPDVSPTGQNGVGSTPAPRERPGPAVGRTGPPGPSRAAPPPRREQAPPASAIIAELGALFSL